MQTRAAAARRVEEARIDGEVGALVQLAVEELGSPEDVDPLEAVMAALYRARVMARVYGWLHAGLAARPDAAADGTRPDALYGPDHLGDARPHALEMALRHWTTEEARIGKLAIDAGIETLRLERMERKVDDYVDDMNRYADALGQALERVAELDVQVLRVALVEARLEAFRQALGPGRPASGVVEAEGTEVARDDER